MRLHETIRPGSRPALYQLAAQSDDKKLTRTRSVAAIYADASTCPPTCGQQRPDPETGEAPCYALRARVGMLWRRLSGVGPRPAPSTAVGWAGLCDRVRKLAAGTLTRYGVAGDLPQDSRGRILPAAVELGRAAAAAGARLWLYTHHRRTPGNIKILRALAATGAAVNLSADSLTEADAAAATGLPVAVVVPSDHPVRSLTPAGRRVLVCPNQWTAEERGPRPRFTCDSCELCLLTHDRRPVIAFRLH